MEGVAIDVQQSTLFVFNFLSKIRSWWKIHIFLFRVIVPLKGAFKKTRKRKANGVTMTPLFHLMTMPIYAVRYFNNSGLLFSYVC
jgi:hypothetical protein